jgi:Flp pilus assembly pilin Flp
MDLLPRLAVSTQMAVETALDALARRMRDERGQASTEYAGILFVIVAIIAALIAAGWTEVGDAIKQKIEQAINKIGN